MGTNTNFNIDPYFDDFDVAKQFNRVLFKPARAVQSRELTQMQTILQNQIERFGSNIYKEGTVISGVNYTERSDLFYVKLRDQSNFNDPSLYEYTEENPYNIVGQTSGLRAVIVKGENGFETTSPNLKTFFINYLNTAQDEDGDDIKQFIAGESLSVLNSDGTPVTAGGVNLVLTVSSATDPVGKSFGVTVEDGVIFQRGFFIFVAAQTVIVSKYTNSPANVSVGFAVNELIITAEQDASLYDNAAGFNNENAPGADRLKLEPELVSYPSTSEPENFFAIARYIGGQAVRIRDVTEFNSIAKEMARRTYEESGNYVVKGLNVTFEQEQEGSNTQTYAVVSPGKAYVFGYEIESNINQYREILPSDTVGDDEVQTKNNVITSVDYGSYYEFVWNQFDSELSTVLNGYVLDGTRYDLKDSGDAVIGSCSIKSIQSPGVGTTQGLGRIYVYAIVKNSGQENTSVVKIGDTPVYGDIKGISEAPMIFETGKSNLKEIRDPVVTKRVRKSVSGGTTITISAEPGKTPISNENIVAVDSTTNNFVQVNSSSFAAGTLTIELDSGDATHIYYDEITEEVTPDGLEEIDVYVLSTAVNGIAYIGLPNALQLLEVVDNNGAGDDVTSKFRLVPNQKDGFYDISFIRLRTGETLSNTNLRIKAKVLRRNSTVGSGYLNINSYDNISKNLVISYSARNGTSYDLLSSYDFRPYATPWVSYTTGTTNPPTATTQTLTLPSVFAVANKSNIAFDFDYYMSRIDAVVVDAEGTFRIVRGAPSETPSIPVVRDALILSEIFVPGNSLNTTGTNRIIARKVSTKNYTMKDIEQIDRQLYRLTENVSLALLDLNTKNIFIPDENGLDRFKNGILVDSFKNLNVADVRDPDFRSSIDKSKKVLTPSILQYPIDLRYNAGSSITQYRDLVTISDSGQLGAVISQPFATGTRNATANFYQYNGTMALSPEFDVSYDTVTNPAVNIEIDFEGFAEDLIDSIQEVVPLTGSTTTESVEIVGNSIITTSNVTETTFDVVGEDPNIQNVGTFITDFSFTPYIAPREVKIVATGLRPNTRHYFFFDETAVNEHVYPGSVEQDSDDLVGTCSIAGSKGGEVKTDQNGVLSAVFAIPEGTFYVGESILEVIDDQFYNPEAGASYAKASYHAYSYELGETNVVVTTRPVSFETTSSTTTTQSVTNTPQPQPQFDDSSEAPFDPISQTFYIKRNMAEGASVIFLKEIDLYFNTKSDTFGVIVEIREVQNGYPTSRVLPFARKRLSPTEVNVSDTGSAVTTFAFDNPIKLPTEREYALVVKPEANSPDYKLFISKVGNTDLISGEAVTQDRFDGVLFASTNDRSWKSYQDEDIKFEMRKVVFNTTDATADLIPNDVEILTFASTVNRFQLDEIAYSLKGNTTTASLSNRVAEIPDNTLGFAAGDYVVFSQGTTKFVSNIVTVDDSTTPVKLNLDSSSILDTSSTETITAQLAVGGRVQYFNPRRGRLHLKESSVRVNAKFEVGNAIVGYRSGATTTVATIESPVISYMQPFVSVDNSIRTRTNFTLFDGLNELRPISGNDNEYLVNNVVKIPSKSLVVGGSADADDFKIRVGMTNNGYSSTTPILDETLSIIQAYEYSIDTDFDDSTKSSYYVSKEIVLTRDMSAVGLKVLLAAYRPIGASVDVYARFVYATNAEEKTDWIQLQNANPQLFSNVSDVTDYRQFEYSLDEETYTNEYLSFQVKIVLRHMTSDELTVANSNVTPNRNLFAHVFDYRAIALT